MSKDTSPNEATGQTAAQERFNLSLRKFLKQVGITSQREIERVVREGKVGDDALHVSVRLTAEGTDLDHTVEGRIDLP